MGKASGSSPERDALIEAVAQMTGRTDDLVETAGVGQLVGEDRIDEPGRGRSGPAFRHEDRRPKDAAEERLGGPCVDEDPRDPT